jgi:hypothetical protein
MWSSPRIVSLVRQSRTARIAIQIAAMSLSAVVAAGHASIALAPKATSGRIMVR